MCKLNFDICVYNDYLKRQSCGRVECKKIKLYFRLCCNVFNFSTFDWSFTNSEQLERKPKCRLVEHTKCPLEANLGHIPKAVVLYRPFLLQAVKKILLSHPHQTNTTLRGNEILDLPHSKGKILSGFRFCRVIDYLLSFGKNVSL